MDWEFRISKFKLLYREQTKNKGLLHSTGNYIQYPVINHNEKNMKKNGCVYIYIREGNGTPLQYSRLENPMDGGAWWAAVHGSRRVGHD